MKYLLTLFIISSFTFCNAQQWVEMMKSPNANFYDIQAKYYEEWAPYLQDKSKGNKAFKRWEHYWSTRINEDGSFPSSKIKWDEYYRFKNSPKSIDDLSNWTPLGPTSWNPGAGWNPGNGRINVVAQAPSDTNLIYVGSPSGGLWRSSDHGENWEILTNDLPFRGVSGIAIHPMDNDLIYISTGDFDGGDSYSVGVLKSTDGGDSWTTTGLEWDENEQLLGGKILIHPLHNDVIFFASNNGLYRSLDAGDTWEKTMTGTVNDIEFQFNTDSIVYISTNSFYKSTDLGESFESIEVPVLNTVNRMLIAVNNVDSIVYLLTGKYNDSTFEGLYKSTDGGNSFETIRNGPNYFGYEIDASDDAGQSWYDMGFDISPDNPDEIFIGGVNVFKSTDGGEYFYIKSHWVYPNNYGYTHADIHNIEFIGNTLFVVSDGGIFKSNNKGEDFTNMSFGLNIMQFYHISGVENDVNMIIGGAQDNGINVYTNGQWEHFLGADGMQSVINYANTENYYGSVQNGSIYYTMDAGLTYEYTEEMPESAPWVTEMAIDPEYPELIYAGGNSEAWVWDGMGWIQYSNFTASGRITAITPVTSEFTYVAQPQKIYYTDDAGSSWYNITNNLNTSGSGITDIVFNPANPDEIWVSLSGYNSNNVYFTSNRGDSWENISKDLPAVPVNTLQYVEGSNGGIYIGNDIGVYYTDNTMDSYLPWTKDLPNIEVTSLVLNQAEKKLRASTYGRGLWETDTYEPEDNSASILEVENNIQLVQLENAVQIKNLLGQSLVTVYTETGQKVMQLSYSSERTINTSQLKEGIYFIQVGSNQVVRTFKIKI